MVVVSCRVDLHLMEEPSSLKRKRQIIKGLKERIRNRFGASAAEVGELDKWQISSMGFAFVTTEMKDAESVMAKILDYIESDGTIEIIGKILDYNVM